MGDQGDKNGDSSYNPLAKNDKYEADKEFFLNLRTLCPERGTRTSYFFARKIPIHRCFFEIAVFISPPSIV